MVRRDTALTIALRSYQAGRYPPARAACRDALTEDPKDPVALHLLGLVELAENRFDEAIGHLVEAASVEPNSVEIRTNLGLALRICGKSEAAAEQFRIALDQNPDSPPLLNELALAEMDLGHYEQARGLLERAVVLAPRLPQLRNSLGNLHRRLGDIEKAGACLQKAIDLDPDHGEAHLNIGLLLRQLGKLEEALPFLGHAAEVLPGSAEVAVQLGVTLRDLDKKEEAFLCFQRAVAMEPDHGDALNNLGLSYVERGDPWLAEEYLRQAVAVRPGFAEALANLGAALLDQGRPEEALTACEEALAAEPENADAHWNKALALLCRGDLAAGFEEYEWRWKLPRFQPLIIERSAPLWDGKKTAGTTLLLHAEQGFGDTIQFGRYASLLAEKGAEVVVEVPPALKRLMVNTKGVSAVIVPGETLPQVMDAHVPLLSLPHLLGTTADTIPAKVPYIGQDPAQAEKWARRLPPHEKGFTVGLCWQGSPTNSMDHRRSLPLTALLPLTEIAGTQLFSLQKGKGAAQIGALPEGLLTDLDSLLEDFSDTAAAVGDLDLIITVDTALAHLAGALGRPVWTLLAHVPDWRWGLEGTTTPWYPTMTLFRQPEPGDWTSVIEEIVSKLTEMVV